MFQLHQEFHEDHVTMDIKEFEKQAKKHSKKVCILHNNQTLKFYCRQCSKILCDDCLENFNGCAGKLGFRLENVNRAQMNLVQYL